jgi:hypothetical protein
MRIPGKGDSLFAGINMNLRSSNRTSIATNIQNSNFKKRNNSVIKSSMHSKDEITGIYQHPKILGSSKKFNDKVPKSLLILREELSRKIEDTKKEKSEPSFATSNLTNSSLKPKSDFDDIIKEWSSTNWLKNTPTDLQKPCHILIHDKLLYNNLNLFDIIHSLAMKHVCELRKSVDIDWEKSFYEDCRKSWEFRINELLIGNPSKWTNSETEKKLKTTICDIYRPYVNSNSEGIGKLNRFLKGSFLVRKITINLYKNINYDENIFSKLKNIENLNERNDITIIKNHELTLIPSLDYLNLLKKLNNKRDSPLLQLNVLKYRSILGNKECDYQNLQILKNILTSNKLHHNEKFILITDERATSLEYFRLLKLFNKVYSNYKFKGCVIYLDREHSQREDHFIKKPEYTGKEMYYVAEEFSDIYDIIEML